MEGSAKSKIILILSITTALFLVGLISSCSNAYKQKNARQRENYAKLEAEEKMAKFSQEKINLEAKAKSLSKELEDEKDAHQLTKKALLQEQLVSQSLKEELQKVIKLKDTLEEDLKDALATGKSKAR